VFLLPAWVSAHHVPWSQERLAKAARVGLSTVRDFEKWRQTPRQDNLAAIRKAIEALA
jgi:ribosome-binding protein aMBF1 (putative translation factor)